MMLKDIGEFGFIKKISRGCVIRKQNVVRAIGDDAAAFRTEPHQLALITTDLLVERVHFLRDSISGFDLGHKSLAVNLSDIAAMGGNAREALVSIGIPDDCSLEYLQDVYRGLKTLAKKYDVNILGGDTAASKADLIINIVVYGTVAENELLRRDGAIAGDIIFATGCLGDSKAGLYLLLHNASVRSRAFKQLVDAHRLPEPHLLEGRFLAQQAGVHAAIDISDGLSSDLTHILEESNVGACLSAEKIPISKNLQKFCMQYNVEPVSYALCGGEDYTLLCTIASQAAERVASSFQKKFKRPLYAIGEITDTKHMELVQPDGCRKTISPSGWEHFKDDKT